MEQIKNRRNCFKADLNDRVIFQISESNYIETHYDNRLNVLTIRSNGSGGYINTERKEYYTGNINIQPQAANSCNIELQKKTVKTK